MPSSNTGFPEGDEFKVSASDAADEPYFVGDGVRLDVVADMCADILLLMGVRVWMDPGRGNLRVVFGVVIPVELVELVEGVASGTFSSWDCFSTVYLRTFQISICV